MGTLRYESRIALTPEAEDNGLASMVAALILQNLNDKPEKRADFAKLRGRVSIIAEDANVAMTLEFTGNMLTIHDGVVGVPDLSVRAQSEDIIQLSLVELTSLGALPNFRGEAMRAVMDKSQSGRIRMFGALGSPRLALRLTRLLSVN